SDEDETDCAKGRTEGKVRLLHRHRPGRQELRGLRFECRRRGERTVSVADEGCGFAGVFRSDKPEDSRDGWPSYWKTAAIRCTYRIRGRCPTSTTAMTRMIRAMPINWRSWF